MLRGSKWEKLFYGLALKDRDAKKADAEEFLRELLQGDNLIALLDEFLDETRQQPHDSNLSYFHDNGFDKIVLFNDPVTLMKMRLHIWHPTELDQPRRRQNVHNHRWDYSSAILAGTVQHLTYEFSGGGEDGEEFNHYRYFARGAKEHYEVEALGKAKLKLVKVDPMSHGTVYSIRNEVLHRIDIPDDAYTATIIITHENVGWVTNDLLSENPMGFEKQRISSPSMTKETLCRKVEELKRKLKETNG